MKMIKSEELAQGNAIINIWYEFSLSPELNIFWNHSVLWLPSITADISQSDTSVNRNLIC